MSKKAGLPPGTIQPVEETLAEPTEISIIDYGPTHCEEQVSASVQDCIDLKDTDSVTWIRVIGLRDFETIEALGKRFAIHPLILEDILNTRHRPKCEIEDDYAVIILKTLKYDAEANDVRPEQVSIVLGPKYVISFHERLNPIFRRPRNRIVHARGRVRNMPADYLAYRLVDAIVDDYFVAIDSLAEKMEDLEDELIEEADNETTEPIHETRTNLVHLRKLIWPTRDAIYELMKSESELLSDQTEPFFKDVNDHITHIIDTLETLREMITGLLDLHISRMSHRMNEIMKVLTLVATIFIPLTFIAGIYGMNFHYMPELKWHWGYFTVLGIMAALALGMVFYFRRRHWL
jgi:magnesium transporter